MSDGDKIDGLALRAKQLKTLTEKLDARAGLSAGGARQKKPSGRGKGKWQTSASLAAYRKKRDAKRKARR